MSVLTTQPLNIQTTPLQNGSTLYYKEMSDAPRISLGIYVHGGNRIEAHAGLSDMLDDLLTEGTATRTAEDISFALDSLSLDLDAETRRDYSVISATFLEEDLDASLELIADMLFNSSLADFEKEKVRLNGELVMDMDSPRNCAHDLLMTELFKDTPYQASHTNILKTLSTLSSVEPLRAHYQATYQPANLIFCVVGDISQDRIQKALDRYFVKPPTSCLADVKAPGVVSIPKSQYLTAAKNDTNQLHIYKSWFAPHHYHADYMPMIVLNTILGGAGLTSRLFLELRDKQGLAYVVRSQYEASKYLGVFSLYIGTEPNNRDKALKGFEVECQKLIDIPVGAQELAEAKENILGRRVVYLETASQQNSYMGSQLMLGGNLQQLETSTHEIMAVTSEQVQAVAKKYLTQPHIIAAVGPEKFL